MRPVTTSEAPSSMSPMATTASMDTCRMPVAPMQPGDAEEHREQADDGRGIPAMPDRRAGCSAARGCRAGAGPAHGVAAPGCPGPEGPAHGRPRP